MVFIKSGKQDEIFEFIKNKGKVHQSQIIDHFYNLFGYKNVSAARNSIGNMLKKLEAENLIKKVPDETSQKALKPNVWSVI